MIITLALTCICLTPLQQPAGGPAEQKTPAFRTWTDDSGTFSVEATFVDSQAETIRLRRRDGRVIIVPVARLSESDRRYVTELTSARDKPKSNNKADLPPAAPKLDPSLPVKAARCRFEVSGLTHAKMGSMRGDCMECWNAIETDEGFRELRRHLSTHWTGKLVHRTDHSNRRKFSGLRHQVSTYAQFSLSADLAPMAKAVAKAKTPHRSSRAFYALLYTEPKIDQAKTVLSVLSKLDGVDAIQSTVDKQGIIHIKISGQNPITVAELLVAYQKAGIKVTTSRGRRE